MNVRWNCLDPLFHVNKSLKEIIQPNLETINWRCYKETRLLFIWIYSLFRYSLKKSSFKTKLFPVLSVSIFRTLIKRFQNDLEVVVKLNTINIHWRWLYKKIFFCKLGWTIKFFAAKLHYLLLSKYLVKKNIWEFDKLELLVLLTFRWLVASKKRFLYIFLKAIK